MHFLLMTLLTVGSFAQAAQVTSVTAIPGRVEIHVQPQVGELDVLFVVDDSGSMNSYQKSLAKNVPALVEATLKSKVHVHAGVATTTVENALSCQYGGICNGRFNGATKVADSKSADFEKTLANNLMVGTNGRPEERPLDAVLHALSEPVMSQDHPDFYRPQAHLAVIFLTDADDQSLNSSEWFASYLKSLKQNERMISVDSIQFISSRNACQSSEPQGVKLSTAVQLMNGKVYDICDGDFAKQLGQIGRDMEKKVTREIPLTTEPVFSSITVIYGSHTLSAGDIHRGWTFNSATNTVILGDQIDWSSMDGTELVISFVPKAWAQNH